MSIVHPINNINTQWEYPSPSFPAMSNEDFLAMLEKQVSNHAANPTNPKAFTLTPPLSEDSSPSPPNSEHEGRPSTSPQDEGHKRKMSSDDEDDEDDDPRPHKSAHRDDSHDSEGKRTSSYQRRKSLQLQDESRLLKRKEQNRAAQRAFRERKEKHVKDLEEKVAALEQEKAEQNNENENLRDLLSRLQNENQLLKQGQFTFSVPGSKKRSSTEEGSSSPLSSSGSLEPVFSRTSPTSIDATFSSPMFNLTSSLPNDTNMNTSDDPTMASLFNSFPQVPTAWTTIASNPQYTSYRDPVYDRIFGGAGDVSPYIIRGEEDSGTNLDELFAGEFQDLIPVVGDFSPAAEAVSGPLDTSPSGSSSEEGDAAAAAPLPNLGSEPAARTEGLTPCPETREGVARMISKGGPESTFGPPVDPVALGMAICPLMSNKGANQPPISLPRAQPGALHLPIGDAWKQVKSNPHFEDCDIDDLCSLLKEKARCDGGRPVIEESSVQKIVETMNNRGR